MISYIKKLLCKMLGHDYKTSREISRSVYEWQCARCGYTCIVKRK